MTRVVSRRFKPALFNLILIMLGFTGGFKNEYISHHNGTYPPPLAGSSSGDGYSGGASASADPRCTTCVGRSESDGRRGCNNSAVKGHIAAVFPLPAADASRIGRG